ncbi:MAG: energy transducer TonB [Terriglobales bacterium]
MHTLHDQNQSESHLERAHLEQPSQPFLLPTPPDTTVQRKRMLIALGILLLALGAVILKDWDFWFPSSGDTGQASVHWRKSVMPAAAPSPAETANHERKVAKAAAPTPAAAEPPMMASTQRAVLPPLEVEVVSGNQRASVPARSNAIHVDAGSGASISNGATASRSSAPATVASAGRVQLSPQTTQSVSLSVPPDYPLLARQMKVQGAVSLQALIARDGTIQELEILSGPNILAAAAREAVKQWHFKPYFQNGQPVETQARITVNFTISTN